MSKIKLYIASDHAGYETKIKLIKALNKKYDFIDLGCHSTDSVDYPKYAFILSKKVLASKNKILGILVCGSGFGMSIAACKVKGIYCTCIVKPEMSHLAKAHNNCNVIALSGRWVSFKDNIKIINNFVNAKFDAKDPANKRHVKRLKLIDNYDKKR